ncbi:hypothetical protein RB620_03530 [Paenibacillus sp. LHD-117]|uniref:hypothetical protein n=1 Tax=Paenibacillus sp. LHD-117 TaxID=3071412 RepID=UPI0027E00814|nr:hypothetical protein [Paenibacillus sp. LHD-117]MDQ6418501.1 hypothetical protein [Paenibacillus sp. LHD-117]
MTIFVYSMVAWIVITLFALLPKKLPITENLCVYFCICLLMTSTFTTIIHNFKLIEFSDKLDIFFCREFTRYIIYPVLLLVFTNVFFAARSAALRFGMVLFTFAALCSVHFSFKFMQAMTFPHWNPLLSMLMFAFFMAAAWLLEKIFAYFFRKEEVI